MNPRSNQCNDQLLWAVLQSDAAVEPSQPALQHVAHCDHCQQRLEELAADRQHWELAKSLLAGRNSAEDFRGDSQDPLGVERPHPPAAWNESMAQQLLSPPSHPEMLGRIGRYEVERLLGSGGMGIVFKAIDSELNRPVAIKILAPYLSGNGAARQRFAREAKAAAAVVHEHVVPIHNVETDGQSPYLVMRYVAGESLQNRIDRAGPLETLEILRIGHQVAAGLAAAHAQGLVHRDIKPGNVLVESGVERSLITDFGLARAADDASLTNTGYHPGTPQFMSPEQACGDDVDARSDLFSLGSVIYTMCTGRPPFRAETSYGVLRKITDTDPKSIRELNANIPDWLDAIVAKLMSKSPDDRFESAEQLAEILESCLAHLQRPTQVALPAEVKSLLSRARPLSRYQRSAVAVILLVLVAAIAAYSVDRFRFRPTPMATHTEAAEAPGAVPNEANLDFDSQAIGHPDAAESLRARLNLPTRLLLREADLSDSIGHLLTQHGIAYHLHADSLSETTALKATSGEIQFEGTIGTALRLICARFGVSYIVQEQSIEICSTAYAQEHPVVRFYNLASVIPDSRLVKAIVATVQQIAVADGSSLDSTSLNLIDSVLVARCTESTHLSIEQLLAQLADGQRFLSQRSEE